MPLLAAIVGPIVGALASNLFAPKPPPPPKLPPPPPTLTHDEAMGKAETVLGPVFDRIMRETLEGVDRTAMARGFYGQRPGDELKASVASDVGAQRAQAIGGLAHQMVDQTHQHAAQMAALAQNQWAQQAGFAAQQQQGFLGGAALGSSIFDQLMQYSYVPRRQMENIGMGNVLSNMGGATPLGGTVGLGTAPLSGGTTPANWGSQHTLSSRFSQPY